MTTTTTRTMSGQQGATAPRASRIYVQPFGGAGWRVDARRWRRSGQYPTQPEQDPRVDPAGAQAGRGPGQPEADHRQDDACARVRASVR